MNIGRTITSHLIDNEDRRNDILEILRNGPKTAYKISLEMPVVYATGTTLCRLRELQAAKKIKSFGDLWEIQN